MKDGEPCCHSGHRALFLSCARASRIPLITIVSFCFPSSENRIPNVIGEGFRSRTNGITQANERSSRFRTPAEDGGARNYSLSTPAEPG
jgi:hypothetical protein